MSGTDELLKGNFKVKKPVAEPAAGTPRDAAQELKAKLRKQALSSLGGSMVYVERTDLTWDGDDDGHVGTAGE